MLLRKHPRAYIANIRPECLECGFPPGCQMQYCPKCDADLETQTDGSTRTIDIAHRGETVDQALAKLKNRLSILQMEHPQYLRVIVGRGKIAEEALGYVEYLKRIGHIISYASGDENKGVVVLQLKPGR